MNDHIMTTLKVTLEDGDSFITRFNISNELLENTPAQKIVDDYYVGREYVCMNETSRTMTRVDILDAVF